MKSKNTIWIMRSIVAVAISGLCAVAGTCNNTSNKGFGSKSISDSSIVDAEIIGLQGDLATNCGGFGCGFDFTSDF